MKKISFTSILMKKRMKRIFKSWFFRISLIFLIIFSVIIVGFNIWVDSGNFDEKKLKNFPSPSIKIYDRNNTLLREFSGDISRYYHWVNLEDVSVEALVSFIGSEDSSFYEHSGVDYFSIVRAIKSNTLNRGVVSGASTITMQLIRLLNPRRRSLKSKVWEMVNALRLEKQISKEEILEQYVNRLPFGHGAIGIEAASWLYFRKPSKQLSLAQGAFLAIIPRSPKRYDPYKYFQRIMKMQKRLIYKMGEKKIISIKEVLTSIKEPIFIYEKKSPFLAPHFTRYVNKKLKNYYPEKKIKFVKTTLDMKLQTKIKQIINNQLDKLKNKNVGNSSVIVMDNKTGEILS